jgi:hypothetical protein
MGKKVFMKRAFMVILFVATVTAGVMTAGSVCAEPTHSFNLGYGGVVQTLPHCRLNVYIAEYERMLNSKIAVLGRISEVQYWSDDGKYKEQGRPWGVDIGARYYFTGDMKGFFVGGTVGYWTADWTFNSSIGQWDEATGKGTSESLRANVDIGGRFPIGSLPVSIMPAFNIGRYFSSTSCEYTTPAFLVGTTCSQDTEVEFYSFLAVSVGIGF